MWYRFTMVLTVVIIILSGCVTAQQMPAPGPTPDIRLTTAGEWIKMDNANREEIATLAYEYWRRLLPDRLTGTVDELMICMTDEAMKTNAQPDMAILVLASLCSISPEPQVETTGDRGTDRYQTIVEIGERLSDIADHLDRLSDNNLLADDPTWRSEWQSAWTEIVPLAEDAGFYRAELASIQCHDVTSNRLTWIGCLDALGNLAVDFKECTAKECWK